MVFCEFAMKTLSKKNIALLIICVSIILGAYFFQRDSGDNIEYSASNKSSENETFAENPLIKKVTEIDSDDDGLKDWEEKLWKTELKNPDTDGDGTLDGEETAQNRDPRIKGPDDTLKADALVDQENGLTATQKLARKSYTELLDAKNSGKKLSSEETETIIKEVVNTEQGELNAKVYSLSDILTMPDESITSLKAFGNKLGEIHQNDSPPNIQHEIILLADAVDTKNPEIPSQLATMAAAYQKIVADSLKLKVPQSAAQAHLKLINALSRVGSVIETFTKIYDDPVVTIVGIGQYKLAIDQLTTAFDGLVLYFEGHRIVFEKDEAAYPLLYPTPPTIKQ